jgi:hypothetical protein
MHPNPGKKRRGRRGGTAARRDSVRVSRQFSWLEVDSGKMALSRPGRRRDSAQSRPPVPGRVPQGIIASRIGNETWV